MKTQLRISKYDPARRDDRGRYTIDEWTSAHDIGRHLAGGMLSVEDYLAAEDAYVAVLTSLHAEADAPALECRDVELAGPPPAALAALPAEERLVVSAVDDGAVVGAAELAPVIRACLREMAWCRLVSPACAITFGYDYYAYWFGPPPSAATLALASARRMFLEPSDAPVFARPDGTRSV